MLTYQRETAGAAPAKRRTQTKPAPSTADNDLPQRGLFRSFRFAAEGFLYVAWTQRNFRIQLLALACAVGAGAWFRIAAWEWTAILLAGTLVLVLEMINTAVESIVDMVTCDYHALAKVAKDVSAAAVLLAALVAAVIGGIVFVPYVMAMMR